MRIASWSWGGRLHVGTISADGREATPLAVADATRGALPLIEALARGEPLPPPAGRAPAGRRDRAARAAAAAPAQPLLRRPQLPRPCRRARRERLSRQPAGRARLADRLLQVPGMRHRPARPGAPAGRGDQQPDRLRERARGRDRPRRPRHRAPRAMDHVFGYTIVNDVTARDVQVRHQQWDSARASTPSARWARGSRAPTSSTAAPRACAAGSTASCARTATPRDMIFDIPTLIETCSRGITLYPGDVIATGTPAGVGMGFKPPRGWSPATSSGSRSTASARSRTGSSERGAMTLHVFDRTVVEEEGEGDAVVCVHGLGGSTNTFTPLMPALARHRVIRVDMPGSARSHRVEGPLTIERFVETLLSVCTRLNVTRAHWIGHSLGTIVCQHLAVTAPKLVREPRPVRAADRAAGSGADGDPRPRREGARRGHGRHARDRARPAQRRDLGRHAPALAARRRLRAREPDAPGRRRLRAHLRGARRGEAAAVERIEAPVLLVTGDEDGVAPPQRCAPSPRSCIRRRAPASSCCRAAATGRRSSGPRNAQRELRDFLAAQR